MTVVDLYDLYALAGERSLGVVGRLTLGADRPAARGARAAALALLDESALGT